MSGTARPAHGGPLYRVVAVAAAVLVWLALTGCSSSESSEPDQCLAPRLVIVTESATGEPAVVDVGSLMSVTGDRFADGCLPVEGEASDLEPLEAVRLFVQQGSESVSVAQVSPSESFDFSVEFGLPASLTPGPARVVATSSSTPDPEDEVLSSVEFEVGGS